MSVAPRLNRLLAADGKCFDVAIDHGFFNEWAFLTGIEDMADAVATIVNARPDAIQLTVGQAKHLQRIPGPDKPALVMRTDVANCYGKSIPDVLFSELVGQAVEQAVALDAACVVVNLLLLPDQPELHRQCVQNICRLKPDCLRYGMPLMVEPLVMQANDQAGGYMVDGDLAKITALVRQAAELGADIIKADPCRNIDDYHEVVRVAGPLPVLVRGGGKAPDKDILERTEKLMQQGAAGIVYGRNVIQHEAPAAMTRALMAIVHDGATANQSMKMLTK